MKNTMRIFASSPGWKLKHRQPQLAAAGFVADDQQHGESSSRMPHDHERVYL